MKNLIKTFLITPIFLLCFFAFPQHAAGLTFGCNPASPGGSSYGVNGGQVFGSKFSVGSAGTGDSMSVYYKKYTGSGLNIIAAIYNSSDGLIDNGTTNASAEVTNTSMAWITMNFGTSPSIASGVNRLAMQDNGGSFPMGSPLGYITYDVGDTGQGGVDGGNTYPTFPATFSGSDNNKYSIYCTYTAGGAEDTCTYSGTGDWNVNYSDNCYLTSTTYVAGDFNLIYDSAGSFNLQGILQCDDMNVGAGATISAENATAQIDIY